MTIRYHINGEGNVGECSAAKGQCPFGGADAHFGSREQAEQAAEEQLTAQYGLTATAKKEKKIDIEGLSIDERRKLAKDESTSPETLAELAEDGDWEVRVEVAGNPSTPPDVLTKMADNERIVRLFVAGNPSTPPEVLTKLAEDEYGEVRKAVAENPRTLAKLAEDEDWHVRVRVARNPRTPPEALIKLAEDKYAYVRENVAANPNTPLPALSRLTSDPDTSVIEAAQRAILPKLPWSDNDKEIALGLLEETQGIESGKYFPSLEALQEAVEDYKSLSKGEGFDPRDTLALDFAFGSAESV